MDLVTAFISANQKNDFLRILPTLAILLNNIGNNYVDILEKIRIINTIVYK